jgi:hypothetical protein
MADQDLSSPPPPSQPSLQELCENLGFEPLGPPPSQASLKELCEKKVLSEALSGNFTFEEFEPLEPHLQKILFEKLISQITHFTKIAHLDKEWGQLQRFCPRVDRQIYQEIQESNEAGSQNYQNQRRMSVNTWSYEITDGAVGQFGRIGFWNQGMRLWSHSDLVSGLESSNLIQRCFHGNRGLCSCRPARLHSLISSQLFYYRLTTTFGMPPARKPDGPSCWAVDLYHRNNDGRIHFADFEGSVSLDFKGSAVASADAIRLINFLVGTQCLHPCGFLAGRNGAAINGGGFDWGDN